MNEKAWKDTEQNHFYLYQVKNGLIVGQIYNLAHTKVWGAKINVFPNEEIYLGQYITADFAKRATEEYWEIQERTLLE